jgi:hypothetical protein
MQAQQGKAWHDRPAREFTAFSVGKPLRVRNPQHRASRSTRCALRALPSYTNSVRAPGTTYSCNRRKAWAEPSAKFRSTRSVKSSADCASSSCVTELRVGDGLSCLVCTADSNSCDNQGERADASGRGVRRFLIRCMRLAARARHQLSGWLATGRVPTGTRSKVSGSRLTSGRRLQCEAHCHEAAVR